MHTKDIKLCLIDVKTLNLGYNNIPISLTILANYLIRNRVLKENNIRITSTILEDPIEVVNGFKPDIVGLSVMTISYPQAKNLAERIKKEFGCLLIIGGYHISGRPQDLEYPFNLGIAGEGEGALCDIITTLKNGKPLDTHRLASIKNAVYTNDAGNIVVNPMRPLLPADKISLIRWSLLPDEQIGNNLPVVKNGQAVAMKIASLFSARGCPYKCKFCGNQVLWPHGVGLRLFPAKRVGLEIATLYHNYGVNCINILDDTFAITKNRLRELISELKKRNILGKVSFFNLYIRANLVDEEFVRLLKEFGAIQVFIGIESGSEKVLRYLKNGSLTIRDVKNAVSLFQKAGINVVGSFMLFSPHETIADLEKSYRLAQWFSLQKNAMTLLVSITTPFPGTELWNEAVRMGITKEKAIDWQDFLVIYRKNIKTPKVFFKNNLKSSIHRSYIRKFQALSQSVEDRKAQTENWSQACTDASDRNSIRYRIIVRKKSFRNMHDRAFRFYRHPIRGLTILITRFPSMIKYIVTDTINILRPRI